MDGRTLPEGTGNRIIDAMAVILWGSAWANAAEEAGVSLAGAKIEEVMPPVPVEAYIDAARLAGMVEERNGRGLHALLWKAAEADAGADHDRQLALFEDPDYEIRFGECLAYQGMGDGVSWFDDHAEFQLDVPHFEPMSTADAAAEAVAKETAPTP